MLVRFFQKRGFNSHDDVRCRPNPYPHNRSYGGELAQRADRDMRLETLRHGEVFAFIQGVIGTTNKLSSSCALSALTFALLGGHDNVDPASVRVRFARFGASSLDIEIFAYVFASDWNNFSEETAAAALRHHGYGS